MNILPHKSWNPWSSKNIEKVRKDEEAHQREQDRLEKRSRQADSEARFDFLREQSSKRRKLDSDGSFVPSGSSSDASPVVQRHERVAASDLTTSELFASLEAPLKEPKKEQTTTAPRRHPFAAPPRTGALGEGSHDLDHKRPFYEKAAQADLTPETDPRFRRDKKRQTLEDPLTLFRSHSSPRLSSSSSSSSSVEPSFRAPLAPPPSVHAPRSYDDVPKKAPVGSAADDLVLEKMRRERIERERRERQRAEDALRPPSRPSRPHSASFSSSSSSSSSSSRAGRVRGREF